MKTTFKRIISSLMLCALLVVSSSVVSHAEEIPNVTENSINDNFTIIPVSDADSGIMLTSNEVIKEFKGTYTGWLDIPFTVTDSSRTVKVMYSLKMSDGSTPITHLGVRMSSNSTWAWTKTNLSGSQIQTIGTLKTGNYVLRIKTNSISDTYVIAGQIYYFN